MIYYRSPIAEYAAGSVQLNGAISTAAARRHNIRHRGKLEQPAVLWAANYPYKRQITRRKPSITLACGLFLTSQTGLTYGPLLPHRPPQFSENVAMQHLLTDQNEPQ